MDAMQEEAFVRAFIVPERRDRWLQTLANPERRYKVLNRLAHSQDIRFDRATPIANRDRTVDGLETLLRQKGAGKRCYVISLLKLPPDGEEMPLREAIESVIANDGIVVLCCIPGRLAYYESETHQYILEHLPTPA